MSEVKNYAHIFCGNEMLDKYKLESQTDYEKTIPLEVFEVTNGVVHPLELSETNVTENNQFGGVTDENLNFIELSLTKREGPPNFSRTFNNWYKGANPKLPTLDIEYVDEDVVFIGALSKHYGHFILEGLARLWYLLEPAHMKYKCVFISEEGEDRFNACFKLFGIKEKNIIRISKPTQFRTVIVPEQSIRLHDFYHIKYKETIDKIIAHVEPKKFKKVYFSKNRGGNNRAIGEASIDKVFSENGFNVFCTEGMSIEDTISILKGCEEFAATSATAIHNSIFLTDRTKCICLNRSAHFHPVQTMIDRMRELDSIYVDAFLFSSDKNFGDAPCLLAPTKYLVRFYEEHNFRFNKFFIYTSGSGYFYKYIYLMAWLKLGFKSIKSILKRLHQKDVTS